MDTDQRVEIRIVRVYRCPKCELNLFRKNVHKDENGNYHCNTDDAVVKDVTDTQTGHDLLQIVRI